jgi:hypothetical protein
MRAVTTRRLALLLALSSVLGACTPDDRRPGLRLDGEIQQQFPLDWSFTNAHPEIYIEVATPYRLRHAVTIWCAEVDGRLYVGARDWESKRWPGWADDDPRVRLQVAGQIYHGRLEPVTDPEVQDVVARAYADKYALSGEAGAVSQRYWQVTPRVRRG